MATDNSVMSPGAGGDTIRDFADGGGVKWPACVVCYVTGGSAGAWTLQGVDGTHGLPVNVLNASLPVTGTFWQATQPVSGTVTANAGTGTFNIQANASVNLAQVGGAAFALGQQLAAASMPVVLTAAQLTTLTPLSTVAATQSGAWTVGVSGTVTVSGSVTNQQSNVTADYDTGAGVQSVTMFGIALPASGGAVAGGTATNPVRTDPTGTTTQPVSGTVTANQGGTWTVQPGNTPNSTPWLISDTPVTSGGLTAYHLVGAASTNATSVKASAGQLYELSVSNTSASPRYLKLFDKASAPTLGTDAPVWTCLIPGSASGAGYAKTIGRGLQFSNGIAFALTTGPTDADTGAVGLNEVVVNLGYK